jgi:hypothetical protein
MEFAAGEEAALMAHFYNDLASGCTKFYSAASHKFAKDAHEIQPTISALGRHKHVMMNYAKDEFHNVKGAVFNIVDSLIDSQRSIESVSNYFTTRVKYMEKRIDAEPWKFQLKYSTMVTKYCESSHERVSEFDDTI